MLSQLTATEVDVAVARLDTWLDTMRGPQGYGGPVAHWWQQSLIYTGTGLDWRYEGIIDGYLKLWRRSGERRWLQKAQQAADDLVAGQDPDGHYAASAFEINPASGGTPHEVACDIGLLLIAAALREAQYEGWQRYVQTALRNLQKFCLDQLWDPSSRSFQDSPHVTSFVPNKAATVCDALFLLAELLQEAEWVDAFALPTLDRIVEHQVRGGQLDGAIAQNSFGSRTVDKYFPIYIARCVPALASGYTWTGNEQYIDAAYRALRFIMRRIEPDGSCPTVVYANGRANRYPSWIAPLGDVLRAADIIKQHGVSANLYSTRERLLNGQDASGGIQTASGFVAQAGGRPDSVPDLRDVLHVAGWCDKAFRYLAAHTSAELPSADSGVFETECIFKRRSMRYTETAELIEVGQRGKTVYRWRKGAARPEVAAPEFWLR